VISKQIFTRSLIIIRNTGVLPIIVPYFLLSQTFDFSAQSPGVGTPPSGYEQSHEIQTIIKKYEEGERGNLHPIFNDMLSEWFEYCSGLGEK